ncbi:hypothetical protein KIL84_019439 [Mauremys mutica]|uniref:Endonuclease/exonuclease/phosphatase n=1 Tax=Mauremys mutica TaxID=74926 RepID=A0A9D4BAN1_9SAUR|nr:hypothetical protein KIL84_019439 [Mauremys mutica]
MNFATWNVRTLMNSQHSECPERRTAIIARELARVSIDIAPLSETHRADEGQLREDGGGYTFFGKGKPPEEKSIHGIGFAIKNKITSQLLELPGGDQ